MDIFCLLIFLFIIVLHIIIKDNNTIAVYLYGNDVYLIPEYFAVFKVFTSLQ